MGESQARNPIGSVQASIKSYYLFVHVAQNTQDSPLLLSRILSPSILTFHIQLLLYSSFPDPSWNLVVTRLFVEMKNASALSLTLKMLITILHAHNSFILTILWGYSFTWIQWIVKILGQFWQNYGGSKLTLKRANISCCMKTSFSLWVTINYGNGGYKTVGGDNKMLQSILGDHKIAKFFSRKKVRTPKYTRNVSAIFRPPLRSQWSPTTHQQETKNKKIAMFAHWIVLYFSNLHGIFFGLFSTLKKEKERKIDRWTL